MLYLGYSWTKGVEANSYVTFKSIMFNRSGVLFNNISALRYTIATFDPDASNPDSLYQGGSSAADVFPGTNQTFGGEINGYGEVTTTTTLLISDYTIYYVYDGINPIVEYSPNGSILTRYVYLGGRHIAKIAGADTSYYHCDALGSPRKMTDEGGSTVWTGGYYPFGEMISGAGNVHGFTPLESIELLTGQAGKEYDRELGLNYFCQRYYDPQVGRFMTLDPLGGYIEMPQSQNRYAVLHQQSVEICGSIGVMARYIYRSSRDISICWIC